MIIELDSEKRATEYFVNTEFNFIDSSIITDSPDWNEVWEFAGEATEEDDPDGGPSSSLSWCYEPMWGTWFEPREESLRQRLEAFQEQAAGLGFTIIYRDGDFFGLGIDGAGYNFYEEHWLPLYRLLGLRWHL